MHSCNCIFQDFSFLGSLFKYLRRSDKFNWLILKISSYAAPELWDFVHDKKKYFSTTTLCNKVCQLLATGRWFFQCTDHHDITEILLKVALITINQTKQEQYCIYHTLIGTDCIGSCKSNYICTMQLRSRRPLDPGQASSVQYMLSTVIFKIIIWYKIKPDHADKVALITINQTKQEQYCIYHTCEYLVYNSERVNVKIVKNKRERDYFH
jgi:hypothetical protein